MARTKNNTINETSNKIESVACYIRVSSEEQALHGISLAAQEEKLRTYAENNNMRIVEWYKDEGVSGRKEIRKRPELQRMIQDAEKGLFDRILFVKLDRFFRSVAEYYECMKRIEPVIWTATEEKYDLSNANGRFFITAKLAVAEMEADQTGERINMVNDHKVTTGQPLSGSVPFCYKISIDEKTGRKKLIKNPETVDIMNDAIEHFLFYQSLRQTVIYINTKYGTKFGYKTFSNIFKNSLIYGEYRGNTNFCESFVDYETFVKIQKILGRNKKKNTKNREYIFSGLIKCESCGCTMSGSTTNYREGKDGERYTYKNYRCSRYRLDRTCLNSKAVYEKTLERLLLENIEKYLEDAKKIKSAKMQEVNSLKMPQKSINEINERIDRLNYSWQTGKIRTVEQYEKQYTELSKELEEAKNAQQNVAVKDFSKIEAVLRLGWKEIYNTLDDEHKQAFWRSIIDSIEVDWSSKKKTIKKVNFL